MVTLNVFAYLYRILLYEFIGPINLLRIIFFNKYYLFRPNIRAKHFLVMYVQNVGCVSGDSNLFPCWNIVKISNNQLLYPCVLEYSVTEVCCGQQYGTQTSIQGVHLWMPAVCEIASSLGDLCWACSDSNSCPSLYYYWHNLPRMHFTFAVLTCWGGKR